MTANLCLTPAEMALFAAMTDATYWFGVWFVGPMAWTINGMEWCAR